MSRGAALSLYALLVLIWSSTWVAIKIGLEDAPASHLDAIVLNGWAMLTFGAVLYGEAITARALAGAALVVAGLVAARSRPRARVAA